MAAISRQIEQIVKQITARCTKAEGHESKESLSQQRRFIETMGRKERYKHKEILQPVRRAQSIQIFTGAGATIFEYALNLRHSSQQLAPDCWFGLSTTAFLAEDHTAMSRLPLPA